MGATSGRSAVPGNGGASLPVQEAARWYRERAGETSGRESAKRPRPVAAGERSNGTGAPRKRGKTPPGTRVERTKGRRAGQASPRSAGSRRGHGRGSR